MHRFYFQHANFDQKTIFISDLDELHHLKDVLRLKKGAMIQIFNEQNQEADVIIDSFEDQGLKVLVQAVRESVYYQRKIILACAPPKKDKFEWIVEKCTELGVNEIIPLRTKRGEVIFSSERMLAKLSRFQKVALNAAKQSKRTDIPKIHPMTDLNKVLRSLDPQGLHLFPSLNNHPRHLKEVLFKFDKQDPITVFIGPEGDFTPEEVRMAIEHGCTPVSLGNTVLKVETAAIATISFLRLTI